MGRMVNTEKVKTHKPFLQKAFLIPLQKQQNILLYEIYLTYQQKPTLIKLSRIIIIHRLFKCLNRMIANCLQILEPSFQDINCPQFLVGLNSKVHFILRRMRNRITAEINIRTRINDDCSR